MKASLRLRVWLHRLMRYRTLEHVPNDAGSILSNCSCGGHAIWRPENGRAVVVTATCWAFEAFRIEQQTIPLAQVIGGKP